MSELKKVYLAGPIANCEDSECCGWREDLKRRLKPYFILFDPLDRDYRGCDLSSWESVRTLVSTDISLIEDSDIIFANFTRMGFGTPMEIKHAYDMEKRPTIITVVPKELSLSPWVVYHSNVVFREIEEAITHLVENYAPEDILEQIHYGY